MQILQILNYLIVHSTELIAIVGGVISTASLICALTPTPKDDAVVAKLYKVLEVLALLVGKAKDTGKR